MVKYCVVCLKLYTPKKGSNTKTKYCSPQCKESARPKRVVFKKAKSTKIFICGFCNASYSPLREREEFTKRCSRLCHNKANSKNRTKQETLIKRKELLLDNDDEYLRERIIFNSVSRPYVPLINQQKHMTGLGRYLLNCPDNLEVDHINRNFMDNRKENLRICTRQVNQLNIGNVKKRNIKNQGLPKGVTKENNRYSARICSRKNGAPISKFLGKYATAEEASKAYQKALDIKIQEAFQRQSSLQKSQGPER